MTQCRYHITRPAAVLRVSGEDAPDYLQSQFSNDLRCPGIENPCIYGLWLNQKGKVQADCFVLQTGPEDYLLVSYFVKSAELIEIIEGNIIADEVEIEDATDGAILISFWGGELAQRLLPPEHSFMAAENAYSFRGRRSSHASGEILMLNTDEENARHFFEVTVDDGVHNLLDWKLADSGDLDYERIQCGIPAIPQDIGPGDLPQEAGLEKDAVSFHKGCYLGQEVMARLHAMGKAQRALYRVACEGDLSGKTSPIIYQGEKKAGELRSVVHTDGKNLGLALLKRRTVESAEALHLGDDAGHVLTILDHG